MLLLPTWWFKAEEFGRLYISGIIWGTQRRCKNICNGTSHPCMAELRNSSHSCTVKQNSTIYMDSFILIIDGCKGKSPPRWTTKLKKLHDECDFDRKKVTYGDFVAKTAMLEPPRGREKAQLVVNWLLVKTSATNTRACYWACNRRLLSLHSDLWGVDSIFIITKLQLSLLNGTEVYK